MRFGLGLLAVSVLAAACDAGPENEWSDWTVGVYYTAVQSFYDGPTHTVRGCADFDCTESDTELGEFPDDFIDAVRDQGTGRITDGPHAGEYLNWSYDVGFRLDNQPRDPNGAVLQPFRSAAADGLEPGTRLRLTDCGIIDAKDDRTCAKFKAAEWVIGDESTPGLGGPKHIDLYVGEETEEDLLDATEIITFAGAMLEPLDSTALP
ncbi:hypothetical protein [Nocardia arthritidis]|uniref:3D domain-containing protein n=1 Tax=Nocardia arthritidis TaxID=228602 RepID=A0A6G9YQE1_9NOCA|nr:hypothetical protein [Nocardia arthritidis]QIS15434.1 hypothetical protein F5544_38040 [Nocardia arthritidis]